MVFWEFTKYNFFLLLFTWWQQLQVLAWPCRPVHLSRAAPGLVAVFWDGWLTPALPSSSVGCSCRTSTETAAFPTENKAEIVQKQFLHHSTWEFDRRRHICLWQVEGLPCCLWAVISLRVDDGSAGGPTGEGARTQSSAPAAGAVWWFCCSCWTRGQQTNCSLGSRGQLCLRAAGSCGGQSLDCLNLRKFFSMLVKRLKISLFIT